ncbi:hypothetical protein J2127_000988 [Methanococcus voltae]|uniref:hypothetical protein n=1 Tax=Methanococcus voltae TaxID=2188 RepID=UPI001AEB219D|nr:hypothetical protein [Methanococcus voltae]MBP2143820.1 hypothetical protein [Methanococcus voltae]
MEDENLKNKIMEYAYKRYKTSMTEFYIQDIPEYDQKSEDNIQLKILKNLEFLEMDGYIYLLNEKSIPTLGSDIGIINPMLEIAITEEGIDYCDSINIGADLDTLEDEKLQNDILNYAYMQYNKASTEFMLDKLYRDYQTKMGNIDSDLELKILKNLEFLEMDGYIQLIGKKRRLYIGESTGVPDIRLKIKITKEGINTFR